MQNTMEIGDSIYCVARDFHFQAVLEPVLGQKYLSTSGATVESLVVSRGDPVLYILKTKNSTKISGSFTELS